MEKTSFHFPLLKTERLVLRRLTEQDVQEVHTLRTDPGINLYLDRERSKTLEDSKEFIGAIISGYHRGPTYY